jgi:hypothetical protein
MTTEKKVHWRSVFNSDFLGSCDLEEGHDLKAIIRDVAVKSVKNQEGQSKNCNVATFTDPKIKPMILNVGNCRLMKKFCGTPYIDLWKNVPVAIYVKTDVKAFGDIVEGLRIRPTQPSLEKPKLTQKSPAWPKAIEFLKTPAGSIEAIKEKYDLTAADEKILKKAAE